MARGYDARKDRRTRAEEFMFILLTR